MSETELDIKKADCPSAFFCRDDSTRTSDPYVPNVVRYQLRYIPSVKKKAPF